MVGDKLLSCNRRSTMRKSAGTTNMTPSTYGYYFCVCQKSGTELKSLDSKYSIFKHDKSGFKQPPNTGTKNLFVNSTVKTVDVTAHVDMLKGYERLQRDRKTLIFEKVGKKFKIQFNRDLSEN